MQEGKKDSQGKRAPCFKVSKDKARTHFFSSPARQLNPSISREGKEKKSLCHPLTCPSGKQEKFICVNRSNREQQNSPACPEDMLEPPLVKGSKDSPVRDREIHFQERVQGGAVEVLSAEREGRG